MNWLQVIKAGRENLLRELQNGAEEEIILSGDVFEGDKGKEVNLAPFEAATLAAVLRITLSQLQILAMGASSTPSTSTGRGTREKLLEVIQDTELELRRHGSFTSLFECSRTVAREMKKMQVLEAINVRNKERIATLRSKLEGNEKAKQKEIHKKQEIIASLKDQIQDLVARRDVNLSYIDRSEASRREQNLLRCVNAEEDLKRNQEIINEKTSSEIRVHEDLTAFLRLSTENLDEQIKTWQKFYISETERRNEKLTILRAKIAEERTKLAKLTELYEEHRQEMNEYLEYKEQKRLEAEHDRFLYDTATKIQAWWRGTMVRRGLGPYKKKKKPAKDKKKKK